MDRRSSERQPGKIRRRGYLCEAAARMRGALVHVGQQGWVRACRSGSEERSVSVTLPWGCASDSMTGVRKWALVLTTTSLNNSSKYLDHRFCFLQQNLTSLTHARGQNSRTQAVRGISGGCQGQPDTGTEQLLDTGQPASRTAGSVIQTKRRSGWRCGTRWQAEL